LINAGTNPKSGRLAIIFFYAMVDVELLHCIDRTQMNLTRNLTQAGAKALGGIARVLRTPGTLAFPARTR
jgi:hypothetical protein